MADGPYLNAHGVPVFTDSTLYPSTYTAGNTINVNIPHAVSANELLNQMQTKLGLDEPKHLTDREWLDEQVGEICELAT